jgi:pimeloyl-ACP methyl ester carboxylesterase
VLFFHGNGETVYDYDDIALLFTQTGLNLFLADYRGYGASTGAPTFPSMLGDAHALHRAFHTVLDDRGLGPRRFVMGRSMGGHSAVELAAYYPQQLSGLILDSSAPNISRLLDYLESVGDHATATSLAAQHLAKVQAIAVPTLALHGEWDDLIPIGRAIEFFDLLTMPNKHLIRIPGAGHNDILWVGMQQYLAAVQEFVGA